MVSNEAVATIGLTETVATLIYSLAIGISIAATATVSRRIGEKDPEKAAEAAAQAILLGIGASVIISLIGIFQAENILRLMGASEEVVQTGKGFTRILLGSNVVIMLLFILNGIFRGAGDASIAMRSLWIANILNMILDPIFIFGLGPIPELGVTGAAIATTIGRGTGVAFQLYILFRGKDIIKLALRHFRAKLEVLKKMMDVALTGAGQYIIASASWIFLMRIIAEFGSEVIAGYVFAIRIIIFTILPSWGMANAAATLVGQNLGANQPERAEKSAWLTAFYNMCFLFFVSIIFFIWANQFIGIFTDNPVVIEAGVTTLRIICVGYVFFAFGMVISQAFSGAGDTRTPMLINFIAFWMVEIPLAYILALKVDWGLAGVCWAIAISESIMAMICIYLFRQGNWKKVQI